MRLCLSARWDVSALIYNTPIQPLHIGDKLSHANTLFVKRDDLIPYAFGGNKVRIAAEFIADMHAAGKNALIMYGDLRSNLCRVLGFMCCEQNIPCLMVATSENAETEPSFNEDIVQRLNIPVLQCEKSDIAATVDKAFAQLEAQGLKPYYIYGDRTGEGNEATAANAYAKAYQQIQAWEQAHNTHFDLIVAPYGTGSTLAGLICGSLQACDNRAIVGISISSRTSERAQRLLQNAVTAWFDKYGVAQGLALPQDYLSHIALETKYNCGGYGVHSTRVDELIEHVLATTSLPLDPTYTGKAFRGALDYLEEHEVTGKNVLFIHTGGLPLFFDYLKNTR